MVYLQCVISDGFLDVMGFGKLSHICHSCMISLQCALCTAFLGVMVSGRLCQFADIGDVWVSLCVSFASVKDRPTGRGRERERELGQKCR